MKIDAQAPEPEGLGGPGPAGGGPAPDPAFDTALAPALDAEFEADLDLLMPPRRPWWIRIVAGMAALFAAGLLGYGLAFGYFYPRPEAWGSGSGSTFGPDPDTGVIRAGELFHNLGGRTLEIAEIEVEAPGGIEVLDVYLGPEESMSGEDRIPIVRDDASRLVSANSTRWILVEVRPESCPAPTETADGRIDLTLRLAEPAFPPVSRVVGIEVDGNWAQQACLSAESSDG